jgi:hypothetical protein
MTGSDQPFGRQSQPKRLIYCDPSNPLYDRGTGIHPHTRQGCKKSAKIKLLVDNTYGIKTPLTIWTNYIIKAVEEEKITKKTKGPPTSWLVSPPAFRKSGGKTSMQLPSVKMDLATSQAIFKPKSPILLSQVRFS